MTPLEEVEHLFQAATTLSQWRTVVSRAYYASFRRLVGVGTLQGFDQDKQDAGPGRRRSVHVRLFEFLKASSVPVLKRIGTYRIATLWDLRVLADYQFLQPVTKPAAEEALRLAQEIEDWITDAGLKSAF